MNVMYKTLKRVTDIVVSVIAISILTPLFLVVSIMLLCTGEHYVFYFQKRIGLRNEPFDIWKFATMLKNSPNMGAGTITLRKDPRVLPCGAFLRKTKINELPQIINVFLGNMSLVGPRPLTANHFDIYNEEVKGTLYYMKPGITGIGSIVFRDEERFISASDLSPAEYYAQYISPYKGALEVWYFKNRNLWLDLKLIFLTAWVILKPESDLPFCWLKGLPERPEYLK